MSEPRFIVQRHSGYPIPATTQESRDAHLQVTYYVMDAWEGYRVVDEVNSRCGSDHWQNEIARSIAERRAERFEQALR